MAALKGIAKGIKIKGALDEIAKAKENKRREELGLPPIQSCCEQLSGNCFEFCSDICGSILPCCVYQTRHKRLNTKTFFGRLLTDETLENLQLKAIFGFTSGIFLSTLWFFVMLHQLHYSALSSTAVCSVLGLLLSFGLAFSCRARCFILLMLPQLFSSKGRTALVAYGMVLVLSGPAVNFNKNILVAVDTVTCGQQLARTTTREILDEHLSPAKVIIDRIREVIKTLSDFIEELRQTFLSVKKIFVEVAAAIQRVFSWLSSVVDVCNERMGEPYTKCKNAFESAVNDCRSKLGIFSFLCEIVNVVGYVCHISRVGELLCRITESIKNIVMSKIKMHISVAVHDVYEMFYFNVTLVYHYNVTLEQSKSFTQIKNDIQSDIIRKIEPVNRALGLVNTLTIFLAGMILFKTFRYQHKYKNNEKFDNIYISFSLRAIEEKREEKELETILPLHYNESKKYIQTTSTTMAKAEKKKAMRGLLSISIFFIETLFFFSIDVGLWWLLTMIKEHGQLKINSQAPSHVKIHVEGNGILADMYRTMVTSFDPIANLQLNLDTTDCLPDPNAPDFLVYRSIAGILLLSCLLVVSESYGLRLRHVIMGMYHPEMEQRRASWLYNKILKGRGGYLKHLRRQLRRKANTELCEESSLLSKLGSRYKTIGKLLNMCGRRYKYCLVCGCSGKLEDEINFVKCQNLGCKGLYCQDCFVDINNLCTICMKPVDYCDFSDFSEERDSSEEDDIFEIEEGIKNRFNKLAEK